MIHVQTRFQSSLKRTPVALALVAALLSACGHQD